MNTKTVSRTLAILALTFLSTLIYQPSTCFAQSTAFTYQGRLNDVASPANGSYDLTFALFNGSSGAGQVGSTRTNAATTVSNGLFTVTLDFGNQFPGANRWLEIGVRTNGGGAFATLAPRQALTPTPYAVYSAAAGSAATATTAASASSVAAAGITGTIPLAQLPAAVVTNGASGVNLSGTFSGNGAGLTNIPASAVVNTGSNYIAPSSIGSTISGGEFNRIEEGARNSVIAGGFNNSINTNAELATVTGGQGARAQTYGQTAHAAGSFAYQGDAQAAEYILRGVSISGSTNTLFLDGVSKRIKMQQNKCMLITIKVVARSDGDYSGGYHGVFLLDRTLGSIFINGNTVAAEVPAIYEDPQAVPWKVQLKPNSPNNAVDILVTGTVAQDVRFVAVVQAAEVFWGNNTQPQ